MSWVSKWASVLKGMLDTRSFKSRRPWNGLKKEPEEEEDGKKDPGIEKHSWAGEVEGKKFKCSYASRFLFQGTHFMERMKYMGEKLDEEFLK